MDNKNTPAYPLVEPGNEQESVSTGLTKREKIAAMAMQALIGNWEASCTICEKDSRYNGENFKEVVAINSAEFADALLAELDDKTKNQNK